MKPLFLKGNEAVVLAAICAGCRTFCGYPITPSSEILETASWVLPELGGFFRQMESEIGSIFALYGAGAIGERVLDGTSGPGLVWKHDGLNYACGGEVPCVVVNINRGGGLPLGNIYPAQDDYRMCVKPGGNGSYQIIAFAPSTVQELVNLVFESFAVADRWRMPVTILADGLIGQMKEPVILPEPVSDLSEKPWKLSGARDRETQKIIPFDLDQIRLEEANKRLQKKYRNVEMAEIRYETVGLDNADILIIAFGSMARIVKKAMVIAKKNNLQIGLIRPISLWPFPKKAIANAIKRFGKVLVVEMSPGQMIEDVRAERGLAPVFFYGRFGGVIPEAAEIVEAAKNLKNSITAPNDGNYPRGIPMVWDKGGEI